MMTGTTVAMAKAPITSPQTRRRDHSYMKPQKAAPKRRNPTKTLAIVRISMPLKSFIRYWVVVVCRPPIGAGGNVEGPPVHSGGPSRGRRHGAGVARYSASVVGGRFGCGLAAASAASAVLVASVTRGREREQITDSAASATGDGNVR